MKTIYAFLFIVIASTITSQAVAAVDVYMRVKDANGNIITGESQATNFVGWTELRGYGSSISLPVNIGGSTGGSFGKADLDTFQFQIPLTSISLPLSKVLFSGTRLQEVDIWFVKSNGTTTCTCAFYKIHLESVFVSNISESVDGEGINQQVSFKPVQIAWAYYKQNSAGTFPATPTNTYGWNFSTNAVFNYNF